MGQTGLLTKYFCLESLLVNSVQQTINKPACSEMSVWIFPRKSSWIMSVANEPCSETFTATHWVSAQETGCCFSSYKNRLGKCFLNMFAAVPPCSLSLYIYMCVLCSLWGPNYSVQMASLSTHLLHHMPFSGRCLDITDQISHLAH